MRALSLSPPCILAALAAVGCGGGGTEPSTLPTAPPAPTYSVTATVFYDENGNGQLDASERVRVPGVEVVIGNASARSTAGNGQALVSGIAEGAAGVSARTESLPYYYRASAAPPIQVPATTEVRLPLTLPIGHNNANVYLGYGDSITKGEGSTDDTGYATPLRILLRAHLGDADVQTWGRDADSSEESSEVEIVRKTLGWYDPAYTLILLGTNDWHDPRCQDRPANRCYTIEALRTVVEQVKAWDSLPVLGTIPPANPALAPAGRSTWYDEMNVLIKALAAEQGVLLADLNAEFKAEGNLASLFDGEVHPNDAGYRVLARAWFEAITRSRAGAASSRTFGFRKPR